jgi:fatty-acyl-CoA synthase
MSTTVAELVRARADDDAVGLLHEDRSWTWREVVAESATRAAWLSGVLDPARPPHVGVMLPNVPEYVFTMFGAALAGACVVGLNTTRRGAELARDIDHTACQFVLADAAYAALVDSPVRVEDAPWAMHRGAALPVDVPSPDTLLCLLLTSGSTSAPKAARCSQRRLAGVANAGFGFGPADTLYCPMPLSHGNALSAALLPAVASGCVTASRRRRGSTTCGHTT